MNRCDPPMYLYWSSAKRQFHYKNIPETVFVDIVGEPPDLDVDLGLGARPVVDVLSRIRQLVGELQLKP